MKNNPEDQSINKIKRSACKSKALVYMRQDLVKNKDADAWTQPKDPLAIKLSLLSDKANTFGELLFSQPYCSIDSDFLSPLVSSYLTSYSSVCFEHLLRHC